jgi:hypothetical protein
MHCVVRGDHSGHLPTLWSAVGGPFALQKQAVWQVYGLRNRSEILPLVRDSLGFQYASITQPSRFFVLMY